MTEVWNIYQSNFANDREVHVASFTDEDRANEILNRLQARDLNDEAIDYNLRPSPLDPDPSFMGLPETIGEMVASKIVDAAYMEMRGKGSLMMPLWVHASWLVHELRQRYDIGVHRTGRRLTIVPREEENQSGPFVKYEAEDDLQEAWTASADEVMAQGTDKAESAAYDASLASEEAEEQAHGLPKWIDVKAEAATIAADDGDRPEYGFQESM